MRTLESNDVYATNTLDQPESVSPGQSMVALGDTLLLPPASLTILEIPLAN